MLQAGGLTLSQSIYVKDSYQVVQLVEAAEGHGFPDRPLGTLPITNDTEHAVTEGV